MLENINRTGLLEQTNIINFRQKKLLETETFELTPEKKNLLIS